MLLFINLFLWAAQMTRGSSSHQRSLLFAFSGRKKGIVSSSPIILGTKRTGRGKSLGFWDEGVAGLLFTFTICPSSGPTISQNNYSLIIPVAGTTYSGIPNSLCQQLVELSEIHLPRQNKLLLQICTRELTEVNCREIPEKFNLTPCFRTHFI